MARDKSSDVWRPMAARGSIFIYDALILVVLAVVAILYLDDWHQFKGVFPDAIPVLSLYAMWFGSLGGIVISLKGVYDHPGSEWQEKWTLWHYGRPFSGAVVGGVTYVLLRALSVQTGQGQSSEVTLSVPVVQVAAFVLGTQERRFFNFAFSVGELFLTVPDDVDTSLHVDAIEPAAGPVNGSFLIQGAGFHKDATVLFDSVAATDRQVSSNGTAISGVVPQMPLGAVAVEVRNPDGTAFVKVGGFTVI